MDGTAHILLSRLQFALTTMFHITWAATSVGLSALLVVMEGLWLKTGDDAYYHHTRFWGERRCLFHERVKAECDCQAKRYPRQMPVNDRQVDHSHRCQRDGRPLPWAQVFMQENDSQQYAQDRIDEVSQAGFNNVAGVHRPDVEKPVKADQHGCNEIDGQHMTS